MGDRIKNVGKTENGKNNSLGLVRFGQVCLLFFCYFSSLFFNFLLCQGTIKWYEYDTIFKKNSFFQQIVHYSRLETCPLGLSSNFAPTCKSFCHTVAVASSDFTSFAKLCTNVSSLGSCFPQADLLPLTSRLYSKFVIHPCIMIVYIRCRVTRRSAPKKIRLFVNVQSSEYRSSTIKRH